MKIIYKQGNLLDTDCSIIAHGCNAQGVMGSGVAKAIRAKYLYAYDSYRRTYEKQNRSLELGQVICAHSIGKPTIANCITQEFYGRNPNIMYVNYDAIVECMKNINQYKCMVNDSPCVAMPKIGAGLGHGDWNIISNIIETELTEIQPIVYTL